MGFRVQRLRTEEFGVGFGIWGVLGQRFASTGCGLESFKLDIRHPPRG